MSVTYYGPGPSKERFQYFIDNPPPAIALDVETISLDERMPIGFAIAFSPEEAIYFQVYPEWPREIELLKTILCNPAVTKIAHNIIFDLGVLPMIAGLENIDRSNIWDTNVAARFLGRSDTHLNSLTIEENLPIHVTAVKDILPAGKTMLDIPAEVTADKCQRDARACFMLYYEYLDQIQADFKSSFEVDMAVVPIIIDMSQHTLRIDRQRRQDLADQYADEIAFYKHMVQSFGVEKPGSNQQVGYILATRGNFLPMTRSGRQLSTSEATLEFLDDPMAAAVLGYRHRVKFKSTYLDPLEHEDRFATEYYLDTSVGRFNSRNRNIQNIPYEARSMILPDNRFFTTADYSQEHLYILAQFSQDREMLQAFANGDDIHVLTAERMHISRDLGKTLNYAIPYGATAKTISERAKIKDISSCSRLLDHWFRTYKGAADWLQHAQREGLRDGWALPTLFGRRIKIQQENDDGMKRKAVNYPILGSDGEVIKRAILMCAARGLAPPVLAMTIHDSLVFDGEDIPLEETAKEDTGPRTELQHDLEMIPGFRVPLEVKKTMSWA
jgi:DNA polymerase-1